MSRGVRSLLVAVVIAAGLVLAAGCGGSDSDSSAAACDESSISEAVSAAQEDGTTATVGSDAFGCSGEWAYAFADVGEGEEAITVTYVLKSEDGAWAVQDRETVCKAPGDEVPEAIYQDACESN